MTVLRQGARIVAIAATAAIAAVAAVAAVVLWLAVPAPAPAREGAQEGAQAAAQEAATSSAPKTTKPVTPSSCITCHSSEAWFAEQHVKEIVDNYMGGVHAAVGIGCETCHGGNPDPAVSRSVDDAMDSSFKPNPFIGVPRPQEIPAFCGRCHSDPSYMRQFQPDPRVDQAREYLTSQHGRLLLEKGDTKVATCIDCHGVHGILSPSDPQSPVYPTNVAKTCKKCHGDAEYMAGYTTESGAPLPVDQYARWTQSVHAAAMFEKEDLTAPTCNDCHGNHGAAPPGVESVAFVCGQCHGREAELFRHSPKHAGFQSHNELIQGMGPDACSNCHEAPDPQASLTGVAEFSECSTCHQNHSIIRPSVAMLAPLPPIPCAFCHEPSGEASQAPAAAGAAPAAAGVAGQTAAGGPLPPEPHAVREHYEQVRDDLLAKAHDQGLEGDALFDWMVDQALAVDAHHLPARAAATAPDEASDAAADGAPADGAGDGDEAPAIGVQAGLHLPSDLRPEFENLFRKFRIGKTTFGYMDPITGKPVRAPVRRCSDCHAQQPTLTDVAAGWKTSERYLQDMRDLTSLTARAERITLAARRGGVLTEQASLAVDRAVDAQIQLEVLVHTFDASDGSQFAKQHEEGIAQAKAALDQAQSALDELEYRRHGLWVSLAVILLVLIGLGLKIRQISS